MEAVLRLLRICFFSGLVGLGLKTNSLNGLTNSDINMLLSFNACG